MSRIRIVILPSMVLLIAAGATPAAAQQRVEVNARRPVASAENEPFRRLQRQLDSLAQRYNENEDLTSADRRRIELEMRSAVERLAELMSHANEELKGRVVLRAAPSQSMMPRGWIGIVAEGAGIRPRVENGELIVRYLSYPRIVSVDPSSPAQTAGIIPNDTLVAYNGRDVRENDIYLNRLLKPNDKVNVRLRRDGKTLEVPVVVAEASSRIAQRRSDEVGDERTFVFITPDGPMMPRTPMPAQNGSGGGGMARSGSVRVAPAFGTSGSPLLFNMNGVAGAQLVTITEGLGKRIGVAAGVLVTSAPVGSPASQSGLEDGDVIVKISGQAVRTVLDVRRAVGAANENGQHSVDVEVSRDSRTVKTTLKW